MPHPLSAEKFKRGHKADVWLDVSATVITTLKNVAGISAIPGIAEAASLALQVVNTVQRVRNNRAGFKALAEDAAELAYVVHRAHEEAEHNMPPGLPDDLDHALKVLQDVSDLAHKSASKNTFSAMIQPGVDANTIQDHRSKLQGCLSRFGLRTDIELRIMVHKLVTQQGRWMDFMDNTIELAGFCAGDNTDDKASDTQTDMANNNSVKFGGMVNFNEVSGIAIASENQCSRRGGGSVAVNSVRFEMGARFEESSGISIASQNASGRGGLLNNVIFNAEADFKKVTGVSIASRNELDIPEQNWVCRGRRSL
ncbi:hypothetical protein APHAL10511_005320 [Amanita phalloides]|nr:hypothetical protein APHAL10511_005320 [Amanita phalloides]